LAQHMVEEHGKGNNDLAHIAQGKGVQLPAQPDSDHRDKLKDLESMSGDKFDKRYIEQAGVKDHKAALKLFEDAAKDAKDPALKSFAQENVPHIKEHLEMAQRLADARK
jgi:putative membrane protein